MSVLKLEEYENDFWKDVENRMSWDQIIPGNLRNTKPVTLTQEVISQFARLIGDDNPLYHDEEYAKSTPYGGIVAPPNIHIVLMFACTDITDWMRSLAPSTAVRIGTTTFPPVQVTPSRCAVQP